MSSTSNLSKFVDINGRLAMSWKCEPYRPNTRNASKAVSGTNAENDLVGFWLLHSKATIVLSGWAPTCHRRIIQKVADDGTACCQLRPV